MITGVHHLAISAQDPEQLSNYLCATAGFSPIADEGSLSFSQLPECYPHANAQLLKGPNNFLEILQCPRATAALDQKSELNQFGLRHFCVQNNDCDKLAQSVRSHGGSLIADPLDLGTGNLYAYTRDPEGNLIEIEGLPYAPKELPTWAAHAAIVCADLDDAIEFFCEFLGTKLRNRAVIGPGPASDKMSGFTDGRLEGAWLPAGNMLIELWEFHSPKGVSKSSDPDLIEAGYSHIAFESTDIEADSKRIQELGAKPIGSATENSGYISAFFSRLNQLQIELIQPRADRDTCDIASLADAGVCARIDRWD